MRQWLAGTPTFLRASVRDNRVVLAVWAAIGVLLSVSAVKSFDLVFTDPADIASMQAVLATNPAIGLILGPVGDLSTADGFSAWRNVALGGLLVGIGMALLVTKTSRGQEDSGEAELFASGVMGRGTRLATSCALGFIGSLAVGVATGVSGAASGGSWGTQLLIGATFTVTGWMATGLAAVAAQLGSDRRTASTLAVATLAVLYGLRGFCHSLDAPEWTIWANPLGWMTEVNAGTGSDERWWPLLLGVALAALLLIEAFLLQSRRDFGVGALTPRPGRDRGRLRSVWGLALRLNRGSLAAWLAAFCVLGTVFGHFVTSIQDSLADNPMVQQVTASGGTSQADLAGGLVTMVLTMIGIVSTIVGVQVFLGMRAEELDHRIDPVLGAAVSRTRLMGASVVPALAAPAVGLLLAAGVMGAFVHGADLGLSAIDVLAQAAATVPAAWVVVALAAALVGAVPRATPAIWVAIVGSLLLTLLGPLLDLPDRVLAVNPFHHVPSVFAAESSWTGAIGLAGVAVALMAAGFVGFRRRDMA